MTTSQKTCFKCGKEKPLDEFYPHPEMKDGHLGKCKDCCRADVRRNRKANIEHYRAYDRERGNRTPPEKQRESRFRRGKFLAAHNAVTKAIMRGKLTKKPCEICGRLDVHAHHEDYSKPLDVIWLCPAHHRWIHM